MPDGKLVGGGMPGPTLDVHVAAGSAPRVIDIGATRKAALPNRINANRRCATRPERTRASRRRPNLAATDSDWAMATPKAMRPASRSATGSVKAMAMEAVRNPGFPE